MVGPKNKIKILVMGPPSWPSGKEATCQCRRHEFDPWSRKIPHAEEQLSPRATTPELSHPGARASTTREATPVRSLHITTKSSPHSPQPEKTPRRGRPSTAQRDKYVNRKNYGVLPSTKLKTHLPASSTHLYWACFLRQERIISPISLFCAEALPSS